MSDPIVILTEEPLGADDRVNIETDILARHIARLAHFMKEATA